MANRQQRLQKVLEVAWKRWGRSTQCTHAAEEAGEFIQAVLKYTRLVDNDAPADLIAKAKDHLAEELTDCRMMLAEVEYGLSLHKECLKYENFKVKRTLKRARMGL